MYAIAEVVEDYLIILADSLCVRPAKKLWRKNSSR